MSSDSPAPRVLLDFLEGMEDGLMVVDSEWRFTYVNAAAEKTNGVPRAQLLGRTHWEAFPDVLGTDFERALRRAMAERTPTCGEILYQAHGRWFVMNLLPMEDGGLAFYGRDITERKQAEQERQRLQRECNELLARLQLQFERMPIACLVADSELRIIEWNAAAENIFGYQREEVLGQDGPSLVVAPSSQPLAREIGRRLAEGDMAAHAVGESLTKDGRTIVCEWHNTPLRNVDGEVIAFMGMAQDITERRLAEQKLLASEAMLAEAQQVAHVGSWSWNPHDHDVFWSHEMYRMLGMDPRVETITAERGTERVHPDDLPIVVAALAQVQRDHQPLEYDWRAVRPDGTVRFIHARAQAELDENGQAVRLYGAIQDVTERRQAEQALVRSEASLRESEKSLAAKVAAMVRLQEVSTRLVPAGDSISLLQEIVDTAIAITEADMGCVQFLKRDSDTLKLVASRGFDRPFLEFFDEVRRGKGVSGAALDSGTRVVIEDVASAPALVSGRLREVALAAGIRGVQCTPLVARSGRLLGMLSTHYRQPRSPADKELSMLDMLARQAADWMERTQAEEALRESQQALERADRGKSDFLAALSHELRNPLAPIKNGLLILGQAAAGTAEARRAQAVVSRQVDQLAHLVDDLLDVTRISRNKLRLQRDWLDLNALARTIVEDYRPQFRNSNVRLRFMGEGRPVPIHGDRNRLAQALGNLLQNALKFSGSAGAATVAVSRAADGKAGKSCAVLRVTDTGLGVAPEVLPRLFQPFVQADDSLARGKGGLGLGLALAKSIVNLHGGDISVHSEGLGRGTQFTIRLPLTAARPQRAPGPRLAAKVAARRLLIIEDSVDNATSLRDLLKLLFRQHEIAIAHNGRQGIRTARKLQPEIVLCDIGLPDMDGYAIARAFRADPALRRVRMVALTGYTQPGDVRRAAAAGFEWHLAKPLSIEKLKQIFRDIDRGRRQALPVNRANDVRPAPV
jgi:PAS domain S-box-containing protein